MLTTIFLRNSFAKCSAHSVCFSFSLKTLDCVLGDEEEEGAVPRQKQCAQQGKQHPNRKAKGRHS